MKLNRVHLFGVIAVETEIKNGSASAIINTGRYSDNEPQWHSLVGHGEIAQLMLEFKKDKEVGIEGQLITRSYLDKEGIRRVVSEVEVTKIFLSERREMLELFKLIEQTIHDMDSMTMQDYDELIRPKVDQWNKTNL